MSKETDKKEAIKELDKDKKEAIKELGNLLQKGIKDGSIHVIYSNGLGPGRQPKAEEPETP